jgi:multidrug efflux pump subunit AcrB
VRWLGFPTYYATLVAAIIVVIFSVQAMLAVPGSLFPPEDESRIIVSVELPPGSTLNDTDATTEAMRQAMMDIDGVKSVLVVGGSTPLGDRDVRRASFTIILDRLDNGLGRKLSDLAQMIPLVGTFLPESPAKGRLRPQSDIETEVFAAIREVPDVRAFKVGGPGGGSRPFSFDILSSDEDDLNLAVQKIEEALRSEPMLVAPSPRPPCPARKSRSRPRPKRPRGWASRCSRSPRSCALPPSATSRRRLASFR